MKAIGVGQSIEGALGSELSLALRATVQAAGATVLVFVRTLDSGLINILRARQQSLVYTVYLVIKKYANRRLYNTATSAYVTLDHLSQMVKDKTGAKPMTKPSC